MSVDTVLQTGNPHSPPRVGGGVSGVKPRPEGAELSRPWYYAPVTGIKPPAPVTG